jgi:hypothetical protein
VEADKKDEEANMGWNALNILKIDIYIWIIWIRISLLVEGISFADMQLQFSIEAEISVFLIFFRLVSKLKIPTFLRRIISELVSCWIFEKYFSTCFRIKISLLFKLFFS